MAGGKAKRNTPAKTPTGLKKSLSSRWVTKITPSHKTGGQKASTRVLGPKTAKSGAVRKPSRLPIKSWP